jgi:hypothetical protein
MSPPRLNLKQQILRGAVRQLDNYITKAIEDAFADRGFGDALLFNASFKTLTGGPKWLKPGEPDRACIRKYVGVRGKNDFTLVVSHPTAVLEADDIVHSHSHPELWTVLPRYRDFLKFASVRNPAGIINSAMFSINALTSEYIQRFIDPEDDNDLLRQRLALYKFTDLAFFTGIVTHYRGYFDEFLGVADRFEVVRWEDLIDQPACTIQQIAAAADLPIDLEHAAQIWERIGHLNLTGAHKHNFRQGKGVVGDWRNWMTNTHLEIIKEHGLEQVMQRFGYAVATKLDESAYTPFQRHVAALLQSGKIYQDHQDDDLFGFAFNKSNLDSSAFPFKRYEWRQSSWVERSSFTDEALLMAAWDAAEEAANDVNNILDVLVGGDFCTASEATRSLREARGAAKCVAGRMPRVHARSMHTWKPPFARHSDRMVGATHLPSFGSASPFDTLIQRLQFDIIPGEFLGNSSNCRTAGFAHATA